MSKSLFIVGLFTLSGLLVSGCDQKNTDNKNPVQATTQQKAATTLSENTSEDIKADLQKLNPILNNSNTEALALRDKVIKAAQAKDEAQVKAIIKDVSDNLSKTNEKLMALNFKSKEVHNLTMRIIEGNATAAKMTEISTKPNLTDEDKAELMELNKRSQALQATVGKELNELNNKYTAQ